MGATHATTFRALCVTAVGAVVASLLLVAQPAVADTRPADPATPVTVSADALPTAQVDGVVWSQEIVGNQVFVGGNFTKARPAGAAPGQNTVTRTYLMSYDLKTGVMNPNFAPVLDGQVRDIASSPDGATVYVVGNFTKVNGQNRYRVAAFKASDGSLLPWAPGSNQEVSTVSATASTVYLGGPFTSINNKERLRVAAVRVSDGTVTDWAPRVADNYVRGIAISPDEKEIVLGGNFTSVNGSTSPGYGLVALDSTTGVVTPFATNNLIRNAGKDAAIYSLNYDQDGIYGTGYTYGGGGNLEGAFSAKWGGGALNWVEDCHGDTYGVAPYKGAVYTAGHAHYCTTVGGFPQTEPWTHQRALAFSKATTGVLGRNEYGGYYNFQGTPAPSLLDWYPDLAAGTFTGASQAAWTVSAGNGYVLLGGEFPSVNGVAQQGIVRFAEREIAPNTDGPRVGGSNWVPTATSQASGTARLTWQANYDRDNARLTYDVFRNGDTSKAVYSTTADSHMWWNRPQLTFLDRGLTPGSTVTYRVRATDPFGNVSWGDSASVKVSSTGVLTDYSYSVLADGAVNYWRLGESSGTAISDLAGGSNATASSGVTLGAPGAIVRDADTAASFPGTSAGFIASDTKIQGPNSFAVEAWFKTTSTRGGKIVGFGDRNTGDSGNYDRHVYMEPNGKVTFGVWPGEGRTLTSSASLNDGKWHQVVGNLGPSGMSFYVDGVLQGARTDTTTGQSYAGYWRIGGDSSWSGDNYFNGSVDDVAVYGQPLNGAAVSSHFALGQGKSAPVAAFTPTVTDLGVAFDASASTADGAITDYAWTFGDGATGAGATVQHTYATAGKYPVTLTVKDVNGLSKAVTQTVTVTAPNALPTASFTSSAVDLAASFDASASADSDGAISTYSWNFGDDTAAGTGRTASHAYAKAGSYTVTLTVTDNRGAQATSTGIVTVKVPVDGTIVRDNFERTSTNGLGSTETAQAWSVAGSGTNYTVSGGVGRLTSQTKGANLQASLNSVASADTEVRVVASPQQAPTGSGVYVSVLARKVGSDDYRARAVLNANGTVNLELQRSGTLLRNAVVSGLTYQTGDKLNFRVQAFGTSPTTVRAKVWKAGAAEPSAWQLSTTDSTAVLQAPGGIGLGTYLGGSATVFPLTVTFDELWAGSTSSSPPVVTPVPNKAPTAAFTAAVSDLVANVDASTSTDSDGTIQSYAWDFGDGQTATGATASHTYGKAGTYTVVLTVTDNAGTSSTSSKSVTVTAPVVTPPVDPPVTPVDATIVSDAFDRSVTGGLGTSDKGGAWTLSGSAGAFSVADGTSVFTSRAGGTNLAAYLQDVTSTAAEVSADIVLPASPVGGSAFTSVIARRAGGDDYRGRVIVGTSGQVNLELLRGGTLLRNTVLTGVTYSAGDKLEVKVQAVGTSPTTLRMKVWKSGTTEPTDWQLTTTDSTAALQQAGSFGIGTYIGGASTALPFVIRVDDLKVTTVTP